MLALIVTLDVVPDQRVLFLNAANDNRTGCLRDEPGCLHFDIAEDTERPNRFYFYEMYRDSQALADHRTAPHFLRWRQAAGVCVVPASQTNSVATLVQR